MIKHFRLLASILLVTSLQAAQVAVQRSQSQLNNELFELLNQDEVAIEELSSLLDQGAQTSARTQHSYTPLMIAAIKNHAEACHLLIERGASVNDYWSTGFFIEPIIEPQTYYQPLHFAVRHGCTAACEVLLQHGADIYYISLDINMTNKI